MYVTRHSNVTDRAALDGLWELYKVAYERIATVDITREMLHRHEFDEVLADPTYRLTVVRNDDDTPIAMALVATDISVTRYLSVPYFERTYPERMAQGKVHYVMWVVVHPDWQSTEAVWQIGHHGLVDEIEDGALLVFDLPESNQPDEQGRGAELFYRVARRVTEDVELESFGMSRYYALDFGKSVDADAGVAVAADGARDAERAAT